jgi:hypothetical protein
MKKIMVYFLMLVLPVISFCQKTNDSVPVVKTDYLTKSKSQKTAAWILLGGGVALIGTGFIVGDSKNSTFDDAAFGALLAVLVLFQRSAAFLFLFASGKNKRRAMKASALMKMKTVPLIQKQAYIQNSYPSFSVSFCF